MRKIISLVGLCFLALPGVVAACGGFFPAEKDILQNGQAVIFTVDHTAQQISVYMSLSYSGDAEDFAWVVPVPNEPTLELSNPELFLELDQLTEPEYNFPPREDCFDPTALLWMIITGQFGVGGSVPESGRAGMDVSQQGQLGPYDYAVIGGTDAAELTSWLRENGYKVQAAAEPLIKLYSDEGMRFVAMKLRANQGSNAVQPVKLSFQGDTAMLPLRFSAVAAEAQTKVRVWVFDQAQVAPEGIDRIVMPDDAIVLKERGFTNYESALQSIVQIANGRGFVTEYAQPTQSMQRNANPELDGLLDSHAFLTRMSSSLAPEQMTFDPLFIQAPNLAAVSNIHNLNNRISPYTCSGEILPAHEQIIQRGSIQGFWVQHRWRLPWIIIPGLLIAWIVAQFRKPVSA